MTALTASCAWLCQETGPGPSSMWSRRSRPAATVSAPAPWISRGGWTADRLVQRLAERDGAPAEDQEPGDHDPRVPGIRRGQAADLHLGRAVSGLAERADDPRAGENGRPGDTGRRRPPMVVRRATRPLSGMFLSPRRGRWQTCGMPYERDVRAFDQRAATYDSGWLGRVHAEISDRVADLALRQEPAPRRVLDVGSGTGYLLNLLASRLPDAAEFTGVDAAPAMVTAARARTTDQRARFVQGAAEQLPIDDGGYDLVVSATSFDHWEDQGAGLAECRRALAPGGHLVLADLFSPLLWPTLIAGRRGKARTRARATRLITAAGLSSPQWHHVYAAIIQAVTAVR